MVNVFVDTQVFIQKNFDFSNELFKRLIDAVEDDLISVYLTEVVKKEIESKIHGNVYETVNNSQKKFIKEAKILRNLEEYKNIFNIANALDCISDSLIKQFEQFLGDVDAVIIPIDDISPTLIFEKYFRAEPPFSNKKKDEFPDAFSLIAIQRWAETEGEGVSIISNDQDLKCFCDNIEKLSFEPSLESFFNSLTKNDSYNHKFIVSVYDANYEIMQENVLKSIEKHEFRLSNEDGDVNKVSINDVELDEDPYIIEIEKDEGIATIAFNAVISLHAEVSYIDYASSPYDKEEGRYLFHHTEEAVVEDVVVLPIIMKIEYQDHDKHEIRIIDLVLNEDEFIDIEIENSYDYR
ncbi:hypothetical protein SAMN04488134_103231 [Amphibacillus marinus]|uniref:DUF4935 domain-containing protein n=1 Tax=Amphibacillus marinus TaxID=872970 RepID=A0A1H8LKJ3_9BACI|nr:PIN domain-containing protein [Amphibacillus marinus]SEO05288.1 hypothetical protein SAMN04488134_103231 [Amphibacillus marinus]